MTHVHRELGVTEPCPGEWLGYWLLRIGSVYGMRLRELLALAGVSDVGYVEPTWARLGCRPLRDWSGMSLLLGEPLPRLKGMHVLVSPPARCSQLGYCPSCLRSDLRDGRPPYWRRAWMDPYVAVCGRHRRPLERLESKMIRPQAELHQATQLLSRLADDDGTRWDGPEMTPQDIRALTQLQAQMKPGPGGIQFCMTGAALLRRRVDTAATELMRRGAVDCVELVPIPKFGGWLAGVRNVLARQRLLRDVVREASEQGSLVPTESPNSSRSGLEGHRTTTPAGVRNVSTGVSH